jgi:hypothetical protein
MSADPAPPQRHACPEPCRRDGWTIDRQGRFLVELDRTRSITRAAGMSREGAYRLKRRASAARSAAAWDRILAAPPAPFRPGCDGHGGGHEGHTLGGASSTFRYGKGHKSHAAPAPAPTVNGVKPGPGRSGHGGGALRR